MAAAEYRWLEEPLLGAEPSDTPSKPELDLEAAAAAAARLHGGQPGTPEHAEHDRGVGGWQVATEVFEEPPPRYLQSSLRATSINLTNAVLGAGMLAMPHAFAPLGILGGVAMTVAVALMTYASVAVMLRPTERTGKLTYAAVMEHEWGHAAGLAVRVSIVAGSAGFLVLYLIVLADLLVGSDEWSGIIPDLWPGLPNPLPWYLQRTAMLTWATLLVAPTLSPKTLGGVEPISVFKVFCTFLCVAAVVALAVVLLVKGQLPPVHWLPDPSFFGARGVQQLTAFLGVVPVIMTAFVCQMSVHPLVQDLRDYTPRRMRIAVGWAMALCLLTYTAIGAAGMLVFGQGVQGDVLSNLSIKAVSDILGGNVPAAMAFVASVKVAMAISMALSFPITIWPMREDIIEMVTHSFGVRSVSTAAYYAITYASLLLVYLLAVGIRSAYAVVGLVGATCGTSMAFIFPGMLALRDLQGGPAYRCFGYALIAAGALLTVVGVAAS